MAAKLYPRINMGDSSNPASGVATTPLRIPPAGSSVTISSVQKTEALAGVVLTVGSTPPDVPGGRPLPFRLAIKGVVHLKVAFLDDPAASVWPPAVPTSLAGTKVTLVPANEISAAGLTIGDLANYWHTVGVTVAAKPVVGGYATFTGSLSGRVLSLTLTVDDSAPPQAINAPWFLVIKNTVALWVTFAVSETAGDDASSTELPWIHIPTAETTIDLTGPFSPNVPVNPAHTVSSVRNFGPGALAINASTQDDGNDTVGVSAGSIAAVSSGSITLAYTPQDGLVSLPVDVQTNDADAGNTPFHNARVEVSADVGSIGLPDTMLVLDASGSMLLRPDGSQYGTLNDPNPALRSRWENLVTATKQFVAGYTNFVTDKTPGGRLGIAVFPDIVNKTPGWQTRASVLLPAVAVTSGLPGIVNSLLDSAALQPIGMTPMGDGIGVGMGMFDPATATHRRWLVLMTDGAHNAGALDPRQFYQPDGVPDFIAQQVRMYAIGYTTAAGGTDVDLLKDLAANALNPVDLVGLEESQYVQAAVGLGFAKTLTDTFLTALATSVGGVTAQTDPTGTLSRKSPRAVYEFSVSPFDSGVGIFVEWFALDTNRIRITLISPHCEIFGQAELEKRGDFEFGVQRGHSVAYISSKAIAGDGAGPRYGTWKLLLQLGESNVEGDETYKFSIFNRSGLRLTGRPTSTRLSTNQPIELVARLRANGAPVSGARVVGTLDAPAVDQGSILAWTKADPHILERLAKESTEDLRGLWAIKAQALALAGVSLDVSRRHATIMFEEGAPGVYHAKVDTPVCGGLYTMHVVASGSAEGIAYRRELVIAMNVEVLPDPAHTPITYELADDGRVLVRVAPRDAHGNPVIFDPRSSPRLAIEAVGAKPLGDVDNRFDGTYVREFRPGGSSKPQVVVTFDGETVVRRSPLADPSVFEWMERVQGYEPGRGHKGDPNDALGPVKGPDDRAVPLGHGGALALGRSSRLFRATHIAVFTSRKSSQPYEVFITTAALKRPIPIGVSDGLTQVFEVPGRFPAIREVLIRNAGGEGEPVLVRGVGYLVRRLEPSRS